MGCPECGVLMEGEHAADCSRREREPVLGDVHSYRTGDLLGSLSYGSSEAFPVSCGTVIVTRGQAAVAATFGWSEVESITGLPDGLVMVERGPGARPIQTPRGSGSPTSYPYLRFAEERGLDYGDVLWAVRAAESETPLSMSDPRVRRAIENVANHAADLMTVIEAEHARRAEVLRKEKRQ